LHQSFLCLSRFHRSISYLLSFFSHFLSSNPFPISLFFFFNNTPPPDISPLSLHDALPICPHSGDRLCSSTSLVSYSVSHETCHRSEEHTSELQSLTNLVCRLLLEKKKQII